MGREEASLAAARRNVEAWTREMNGEGLDAIVITTSGCGTTIKDYGFMLRNEPDYAQKAARVSAIAKDLSEFLSQIALPHGRGRGRTVGYTFALSPQHREKVNAAPK